MFEQFAAQYAPARVEGSAGAPWNHPLADGVAGYAEFMDAYAGATFVGGLLRIHDAESGPQALALLEETVPGLDAVLPFAYDWLGRQLTIYRGEDAPDGEQVLLFDVSEGGAFEVPTTFAGFFEQMLLENPEPCVEHTWFAEWAVENQSALPLGRDEAVGFVVPLAQGGGEENANLAVADLATDWRRTAAANRAQQN